MQQVISPSLEVVRSLRAGGVLAAFWLGGCAVPELELGSTFERTLRTGAVHDYHVELDADDFLSVLVEQRGVDAAVEIHGPDDQVLAEIDSPTTRFGPETASAVAPSPGLYLVRVKTVEEQAAPGTYRLTLAERRPASPGDHDRIRAEELFSEAGTLHWEGTIAALRQASARYAEALALFEKVNAPRAAAWARLNLGEVRTELDDPEGALTNLELAMAEFRALGDRYGEAETMGSVAFVYQVLGENQRSLPLLRRALSMQREHGDRQGEATTLHNVAAFYQELGDADAARDHYQLALDVALEIGDRYGATYTLLSLGRLHHARGEVGPAFEAFNQALELCRGVGDPRGEARTLAEIATLHETSGDLEVAVEWLRRAIAATARADSRAREAQLQARLGTLYARLGREQAARAEVERALELSREAGDRVSEAAARFGAARVAHHLGDLLDAREQSLAALDVVDELRARLTSQRLRASYLAYMRNYYELALEVLMALETRDSAGAYSDGIYLAEAFELSERFRARSLLDRLHEAGADIRRGVEPALMSRERHLRTELNEVAEEHFLRLAGRADATELSEVRTRLEDLVRQFREVQGEIRLKSPRYAALTQPRPLSLEDVRRRVLDDETLLLVFSLGDARSFLWAVTTDSARGFELPPRADVERPAREVYAQVTARNTSVRFETPPERGARVAQADAELRRSTADLSRLLLAPVAETLGTKRLVIVADGALHYVPFAALPSPRIPGEQARSEPLIAGREIVYLPSASVLDVLRRERPPVREGSAPRLAVFADPVFSEDDSRWARDVAEKLAAAETATSSMRSPPPSAIALTRLPYTRQEAESILRLVPPEASLRALGFAAHRGALVQAGLERYRTIHVATHTLLNDEHPELSGIVLSLYDEKGRPRDGFLRLHDIYNLELDTELVVLSACRSALGQEIRGEGLVGLARGFMYAGSPRVVAALWDVDDEATAFLMESFYTALLRRGMTPAAALRDAQQAMQRQERWRAPYFWAAFALQGEWSPSFDIEPMI